MAARKSSHNRPNGVEEGARGSCPKNPCGRAAMRAVPATRLTHLTNQFLLAGSASESVRSPPLPLFHPSYPLSECLPLTCCKSFGVSHLRPCNLREQPPLGRTLPPLGRAGEVPAQPVTGL